MIRNGYNPASSIGIPSATAITSKGIALNLNGAIYDGTLGIYSNYLGIAAFPRSIGEVISIYNVFDVQKVKAGSGLFAKGDLLTSDSECKFITATADTLCLAYALEAGTTYNEFYEALIISPMAWDFGGATSTVHNNTTSKQGGTTGQYYHLTQQEYNILESSLISTITASENIAQYDLITIDGYIANSATVAHRNKIVGIALAAITTGNTGLAQTYGEITNAGWSFTAGDTIYLNGTSLSNTAPVSGFSIKIGMAKSTTTIFVRILDSVLI